MKPRDLKGYELCSWCLKRLTGREEGSGGSCYICSGIYRHFDKMAKVIAEGLREYEFETFLLGVRVPSDWVEREDRVRAELKLSSGLGLKKAILVELGRRVEKLTGKRFSLKPDLVAIFDVKGWGLEVQTRPLYLFGRYLKSVRGIPQKRRRGYVSIEELVSRYLTHRFGGSGVRLAWFGGEDLNSLVLGNGRPFIARVSNPRVRSFEFKPSRLDGIELIELGTVNGFFRSYFRVEARLRLRFEGDPHRAEARDLLVKLKGKKKRIYEIRSLRIEDKIMELYIRCDGGISFRKLIKEGDPSLESILGVKLELLDGKPFDILSVELKEPIR